MSVITDCRAGQVFLLDYTGMGLQIPEMVKERLVVVVSPRSLNVKRRLATVVPLSTTPPREKESHVVPVAKDYAWLKGAPTLWAKADMIYTPALERLGLLHRVTGREGRNHNPIPQMSHQDLKNIRLGLAHAIGLEEYLINDERRKFTEYMADRYSALIQRLRSRRKK